MLSGKVKATLFILVILFCAAAVNAESFESADVTDVKSDKYVAVIDDENSGSFTGLNSTINSGNNEIKLTKNYTYDSNVDSKFENGINISKDMTIDGQGHAIDGNHQARIFNVVSNATLILKNIKLINGNSETGGAVNIQNGTLAVENSTFINNTATNKGGAIYSDDIKNDITVIDSSFINNTAGYDGGAISCYNWNYGAETLITINNSTFINNVAKNSGGAVCVYMSTGRSDIKIKGSSFINNTAFYSGGAVSNSVVYGGEGDMNVTNSIFEGNSAKMYGGAIVEYRINSLHINNSTFTNNTSNGSAGAIEATAEELVTITNSTFDNNYASYGGGALVTQISRTHHVTIIIDNSTFTNNKAGEGGGGAIGNYHGVVASNTTLNITNSVFVNNTSYRGGAISSSIDSGTLIIKNSTFTNNKANYEGVLSFAAPGGTNSKMIIMDTLFDSNIAYNSTGIMYTNSAILLINNTNFTNNAANDYGGAIYLDSYNATIDNTIFSNNTCKNSGGAIYIEDSNIIITNSIFENNAGGFGGAIYNEGNLTLMNSNFSKNNGTLGGVIGSEEYGSVTIINSTFAKNTADKGGVIYSWTVLNIKDSIFNDNNAVNGGTIYCSGNATITNSIFKENKATNGGAIFYTSFYNLYLEYMKESYYQYYGEEIPEELLKEIEEDLTEYAQEMEGTLTIVGSMFGNNHGKLGDDIYTGYNTTVSGNNYTKDSYANIYANNTIVNCSIVSVLENTTIYVTVDNLFTINATVFADGASVNGYNLTFTDGTHEYGAVYKGHGIYEIAEKILAEFRENHYTAILNSIESCENYIVRNGTVIANDKKDVIIDVEVDSAVAGGNITGNITLRDEKGEIANITGEVTIEIEGRNYTVHVTEGKGTFNIEDEFGPGNYTVNASFPGNDQYNPSEGSADFTIEDDGIVLGVDDLTKYYGNDGKLIIVLTDLKGNPLADQEITIWINGVAYTRVTDSQGRVMMNIGLIPGIYEVAVSYGNITEKATVTILSTVEAEDLVKYFRNGTEYYARFLDVDGNPLANAEVTFNIHGVFYTRTTDENGIAKLNINLNPGEYIITAFNPVNNESKANVITVLSTIFGENVVKFYRNGTQYYAYVLDAKGNPLANANVTFNIHGVFYNRTTDEKGIVKLNINLNPGEYIITAWNLWNGEAKSNNITVYNVVLSEDLEMTTSARKPFKVTILGEQGKPLANANVSFNIHGVFYYKTTDANGEVSLDINLIAGKYIITTYYNEYAVSNTIVVK